MQSSTEQRSKRAGPIRIECHHRDMHPGAYAVFNMTTLQNDYAVSSLFALPNWLPSMRETVRIRLVTATRKR
jgi:hypothetical protein